MKEYTPNTIEPKWQKHWEEQKFFHADDNSTKEKWYTLVEFPYPSGAGLHVGHVRSYTALDILSRKKRMQGFNVLYPIGWDAFGLPTENYAIKNKIQPQKATEDNIANFKRQIQSMGLSFDWSREVNTTDPKYYKWTQWIFQQLFKKGMAYQDEIPINWCQSCKIGLANEEVINGNCERCGHETEKRLKKQWMLKITDYAERLLNDLDDVDYLNKISAQQKNWIGRSEGINIHYHVEVKGKLSEHTLDTFTKYPETNFGSTFIAIAPEHSLVSELTTDEHKQEVDAYIKESTKVKEMDRTAEDKEKSGVFTGSYAINQMTGEKLPIWVADFVLAHFGTGVVTGVPAHDLRDWQFAKKYDLPIVRVIKGKDGDDSSVEKPEQVTEDGEMINSDFLNGMDAQTEAKSAIMDHLEKNGWGTRTVTYSLRDWVFSRQRYWGEPIPLIYCEKECGWVAVPEEDLPVTLPDVENYEPTDDGESPLATIDEWVNVKCPTCGADANRETDTMPNWAGSSWYFLRYIDAHNDKQFADPKKLQQWLPVDLYNGGMEHTTLHLLYSRFWHKFLFDIGEVPTPEPYYSRRSHGMVLADDGKKMSKSIGNVVNPDDIINEYGADTLRLYEMFMGPFDEAIAWDPNGVRGIRKFIDRVWRLQDKLGAEDAVDLTRVVHQTIKKVTEDIDAMKFNTAVAQMMICVNTFEKAETVSTEAFKLFISVFSLFAPHAAEEMWESLGHAESITQAAWPSWDETLLVQDTVMVGVQVNGKVRGAVELEVDSSEQDAIAAALGEKNVQKHTEGKEVIKSIYVPGKIVNIVVK